MFDPTTIRALSFDCYGTLIDEETGLTEYIAPLLARSSVTPAAWAARWAQIQSRMLVPYRPYREVLQRSYDATMQHFGLEAFIDAGAGLARAVASWRPFADTSSALRRLARRRRLAIVCNADRESLAGSLGQLQAPISVLVTAADVRAYKPDPRPFTLLLERLQEAPQAILHVACSEPHDLAPARALGLRTCHFTRDASTATSDVTAGSIAELVRLFD